MKSFANEVKEKEQSPGNGYLRLQGNVGGGKSHMLLAFVLYQLYSHIGDSEQKRILYLFDGNFTRETMSDALKLCFWDCPDILPQTKTGLYSLKKLYYEDQKEIILVVDGAGPLYKMKGTKIYQNTSKFLQSIAVSLRIEAISSQSPAMLPENINTSTPVVSWFGVLSFFYFTL